MLILDSLDLASRKVLPRCHVLWCLRATVVDALSDASFAKYALPAELLGLTPPFQKYIVDCIDSNSPGDRIP